MTPEPKTLFLVGASGYVGGELLYQLLQHELHFQITALLRTQAQADELATTFPTVRTVLGDLDSSEILSTESSNADIIIQSANCDHLGILTMLKGASKTKRAMKPLIIQMSGTGSLVDSRVPAGSKDPLQLSDRDDIEEFINLPATRTHIPIERKIYAYAEEHDLKVIVLFPGQIFGRGNGPITQENRMILTPVYDAYVKHQRVWMIDNGSAAWGWTSVRDIGRAATFLLDEWLKREKTRLEFGRRGIYCIGTGEVTFKERAEHAAQRLFRDGKVRTDSVETLSPDESKKREPNYIVNAIMASNSRYRADRLAELGFKPQDKDWKALCDEGKFI